MLGLCYNISMPVSKGKFQKACPATFRRGFTLVELLVVISIFVVLTGVVLFNQQKFNSTILLTNLAYDTALTIRQAQNYGINVRGFSKDADTIFFRPYGVTFDTYDFKKSFILHTDTGSDTDTNYRFGGDRSVCEVGSGCLSRYNITRGNQISKMCRNVTGDCDVVYTVDIIFKRPNPDAEIWVHDGDNWQISDTVKLILSNADKTQFREVIVQANGLIYIADH